MIPLQLEDLVLFSLTLYTVLRLMENSISMHLLLCGGIKLTKTKDILAIPFRFGRVVNIYPLEPPCLCQCREQHKNLYVVSLN